MTRHIHFVTGRLAEAALRRTVAPLADSVGFDYSIQTLPITVAALMTPQWIAARIQPGEAASEVLVPGYCDGDLSVLLEATGLPVQAGPRELRALPEYFGHAPKDDYGEYAIEILAEINHAPRLPQCEILRLADRYRDAGAEVIDLGCDPAAPWAGIGACVRALRNEGHRLSVDSFCAEEVARAVDAGAELVLSVNGSNRAAAPAWGCEVVVIPDEPRTLHGLDETVAFLEAEGVPMRLDPVLDPIGCGFAASLARYQATRERYPTHAMMMGIGNLTELTDVDSAGVNTMLLGFCAELGVGSVLTTEVINWARSSVAECALARQLVHYAVRHGVPPKRLDDSLVMLRDSKLYPRGRESLEQLAQSIKDRNYRIVAENDELHLLAAGLHLTSEDAFDLLRQLQATEPTNLDASHAFYLGYELAKATTAITLGKQYEQDEALDWGWLTRNEPKHRGGKRA